MGSTKLSLDVQGDDAGAGPAGDRCAARDLAEATPEDKMALIEREQAAGNLAFPQLGVLNVMRLATPESAVLAAVIFNAVIIIGLIPLALKGIAYRPLGAAALLRRNLFVYGLGGVVVPFIGIKAIDVLLVAIGLA